MSAADLIVASDATHLISDGLVWDVVTNEVTVICPKVIMLPQFKCAATMRAESFLVFQAVALSLSTVSAAGYDGFKSKIIDALKTIDAGLAAAGQASDFEVSVAGISESVGPNAFRVTTRRIPLGTTENIVEPWAIIEMPAGYNPCCASEEHGREILQAISRAPRSLDGHAIASLKAQRDIAQREYTAGRVACWTGGFVQVTTCAANSISTRIIHRWPDVVGEKVAA